MIRFLIWNCEQRAVILCGMAKEGLKPVFAVYSTFLQELGSNFT
jgi:deoxyxylulose-5-phosphate synthase